MKRVALAAILCGALCTPLFAQKAPVDTRQENQKTRIRQGVKSGELTRKEARQLVNEQKKIRAQIGVERERLVRVRVLQVWKGDLQRDSWIEMFADDMGGGRRFKVL